jgi:DNA (cytosine-5)-methyltransferase 1
MNYRPTAIDLFSGCGGLTLGLVAAGFDIWWANEAWEAAAATYRATSRGTTVYTEDASALFERMLNGGNEMPKPGEVDLVAGGPPCQGFSGYNRHRCAADPRNSLVETFLDFVDYLRPSYVLMENVPGLLSMEQGRVIERLINALSSCGYTSRLGVLQAGYYGLPQNRWRVFIVAGRDGRKLPELPEPTHSFPRTTIFGATKFRHCVIKPPSTADLFWRPLPQVTVADAISDLPAIENGNGIVEGLYHTNPESEYQSVLRGQVQKLTQHVCAYMGPVMLDRIRAVPRRPGAGWLDLPEHLKPRNLARHGDKRYDNRFGRLHWEGTFNTILTRPYPYWSRVIHPEQDRVISVRESARAQGFPDMTVFSGTLSEQYRQIGNAVPPPLAAAVGKEVLKALNGPSVKAKRQQWDG